MYFPKHFTKQMD